MNPFRICLLLLTLAGVFTLASTANGQNDVAPIPEDEISALGAKRVEAGKAASASRKKLAIRRVIRPRLIGTKY